MFRRWILITFCLFLCKVAHADLNQYMIRTTEWLVDHSKVICVAEFEDAISDSMRRVLTTIKGDAKSVKWPLKKPKSDGYMYFGPPSKGTVRLVFIGENHEMWQAVQLGRHAGDSPTLHDVLFGVSQYGKLYVTESSLIDAIRTQMAAPPSNSVVRFRSSPHFGRSGIETPPSFPFENGGETFVLVVDFNERRRDHFLRQLKAGDCAERLHAIRELSQLEDSAAGAGVEAATRAVGVTPSHVYRWSDRRVHSESDDSVRLAAQNALKRMEKSRTRQLRGRPPRSTSRP